MTKKKPDHHDADIVLKLYELRREEVMRQSRNAIAQWLPRSFEDVLAITQAGHPHNAAWRQVSSYFEMAWGFARHGVVHADLLAENTGEGFLLYAKILPYLGELREKLSPTIFLNAEWIVERSPSARRRLELFEKRVRAQLDAGG